MKVFIKQQFCQDQRRLDKAETLKFGEYFGEEYFIC